jgi:tetratricopeptide (TPR) repeat protein
MGGLRAGLLVVGVSVFSAAQGAAPGVSEAQALMGQGQFEQALARLDRHLSAAPQDAEARFTRGLVLVRLNRNDDAAKAFTELTRDYPQLPEPYNNLAVIYAQQGEYDKAREALEAALATHPSYPVAHENLGDIYAALAAAAYNRALSLDSNNASVRAKLNLVNQLDGLADSGVTVAARATLVPPGTPSPPTAPAPDTAAVSLVVTSWAEAWSAKDVDRYLAFYAPEFAPEGGASRQAWEAQRRARIIKPREIKVSVSDIKVSALDGGRVQVTFRQDYQSDTLSNQSIKVLEMAQFKTQWLIRREYSR